MMQSSSSHSRYYSQQQQPHLQHREFDPRMLALTAENASLRIEIQTLRSQQQPQQQQQQLLTAKDIAMNKDINHDQFQNYAEWKTARLQEENKRFLDREDAFIQEVDRLEQLVQTLEGDNFQLGHKRRRRLPTFSSTTGDEDEESSTSSFRNDEDGGMAQMRLRVDKLQSAPYDTTTTPPSSPNHVSNTHATTPNNHQYSLERATGGDMMKLEAHDNGIPRFNIVSPGKDASTGAIQKKKKTATIDVSVALRARIKFLEDSLASSKFELETARGEKAQLGQDLARANVKVQAFKAAALHAKAEKERLRDDVDKVKTDCMSLQKELEGTREEIALLGQDLARANVKVQAFKAASLHAKAEKERLQEEMSKAKAALKMKLEATDKEHSVSYKADTDGTGAPTWKARLESMQRDNHILGVQASKTITSLRAELTSMKSENAQLRQEVAKAQIVGHHRPAAALRPTELAHAQSENARLHTELIKTESAVSSLRNELVQSHQECFQTRDDLTKANDFGMKALESISSLRTELAASKSDNVNLREVLNDVQKRCSDLKSVLVSKEENGRAILGAAQQVAARNTELEAETKRLHRVVADREKFLQTAQAQVTKLSSKLTILKQRVADSSMTISQWATSQHAGKVELQNKIVRLEAELTSAQRLVDGKMILLFTKGACPEKATGFRGKNYGDSLSSPASCEFAERRPK